MNLPDFWTFFQAALSLCAVVTFSFAYFAALFFLIVGSFTIYESVKDKIKYFFKKNKDNKV